MERPAPTNHPIHDPIRQRWSPRAFSERMVEREKLLILLEAARWAASCYNEQPWSFIVATKDNQEEYERVFGCLVEGNQEWARQAPVLMISVAKTYFEKNRKPNRTAQHDVGLAVENLVIQATALGLFAHQMAGIHLEKTREVFGLPEGHDPVAGIAIGYAGDPQSLSDDLRQRELAPRTRKPLTEFVFTGRWGKSSPWI